jgi:hypothetical protein
MDMNLYLEMFFEEKEIHNELYEIDHDGVMHFIDTETIITMIKRCGDEEKRKIVDILEEIDYKNGDIQHFLKHLAIGFVKMNY